MIKDSCYCGARFEVVSGASGETKDHERWLEHHAKCREAFVLQKITVHPTIMWRCTLLIPKATGAGDEFL